MSAPELEALVDTKNVEALRALYGNRADGMSQRQLLRTARKDFHTLAMAAHPTLDMPQGLEPVSVEASGVTYEVFGVIHGILGGDQRSYIEFVSQGLQTTPRLLMENGIGYYYKHPHNEWIPDFIVLGVARSFFLGLGLSFRYPLLMLELIREVVGQRGGHLPGTQPEIPYSDAYHLVDPELRRGFEKMPPLTASLEIAVQMPRYDRWGPLSSLFDPYAVVPRSLYMAGYAHGVAEREGIDRVGLLVGDLHTMEIIRFFDDPRWTEHRLFQRARRFALRSKQRRRLGFAVAKLAHLASAGLGGLIPLSPFYYLALRLYSSW